MINTILIHNFVKRRNIDAMKRKLLLIALLISSFQIFSQNLIAPVKSESFGLNNHTNRDISYFSHVDSNKNTLIIGTTERDSTFTDISVSKIDENFQLVWQKRFSIDTDLSYDIPVKSFVSANDEVYIVGRSSFNQSNSNGLVFVTKYDANGNLIFNQKLGDVEDPQYSDYRYLDANLNPDGTLNLVYSPINTGNYEQNDFVFLKINNDGTIRNSFTTEIPGVDFSSLISNEIYYFLVKELIDPTNIVFTYKLYKVVDENNITISELTDDTFTSYYYGALIEDHTQIFIDENENWYLTCHNPENTSIAEKVNISKIASDLTLDYSINTPEDDHYFFVGSFINQENEHITIANNINSNVIEFISVDDSNTLQMTNHITNDLGTGFKKNEDGTFFVTTSNSNILLFSNELTELKSFDTSDTYELTDFSKIDDESIATIGTSYDKMFPESDYFTQLDIQSEKLNATQILETYSHSGIGTSRAFQQRVIVDNDDNYLVLVTEKMGPEYLGIGGVSPPLNKRIIKYDSEFNVLWESEVPDHIYNLVNHGGRDIDFFVDETNYLYLNLPREGDYYGLGYDLYKVSPTGVFEFISDTYVADKFHANEDFIFMAKDYFLFEDSSMLYVVDKENGNLIEEIDVDHEEFLDIFTIGDDYYFYTYKSVSNNTPDFLYLYKNGVKIFTRDLPNNYGIYLYEIDSEGTLFYATDNASDRRINKIDINNNYSYYNTSDDITRLKRFNNGNIFLYLDDDSTLIVDQDLNFIANGDSIDAFNPYLIPWENYMLFGTFSDNTVRVLSENGEVLDYFKVKGYLHPWYSQFDQQGNLLIVGQFGDRISTLNEYSWFRGFIHNYGTINNILNVEDSFINPVESNVNIYPNPTSDVININIQNETVEKIVIYDLSGKKVKESRESSVDLTEFKTGLYLFQIQTTSNQIITSKVFKI